MRWSEGSSEGTSEGSSEGFSEGFSDRKVVSKSVQVTSITDSRGVESLLRNDVQE